MMRRALPHAIALLLGAGAALLVGCGGGTKGGIPAASAGELKSELASVQQVVQDGHCDQVSAQLKQVDSEIDGLPQTVDERLLKSLRDASGLLRTTSLDECDKTTQTQTQTQPTQTQTETQPAQTQTQPTQTSTQPTQTTTPPPTATQPTQTATNPAVPPPVVAPPAPQPAPGGSGGGATPGIQP